MKLYTSVEIVPSLWKIGYGDKILLLGSCFSDNIGTKFAEHYFRATTNPLGTLYNPASIALSLADTCLPISDSQIIYHNGLWHSMMHHGSFSGVNKEEVLACCQQSKEQLQCALNEATTVIITFGTAWVYEMDGKVVANCHKLPANRFTRRCLTVSEIVDMWRPIVENTGEKHWIFTVSPIRHVKDGLHTNQLSKAILLQAIDQLCQLSSANHLSYFPSYEIMLDELRDYRFYAEDLVHPSAIAVEYIWQKFVDTYMADDTQREMQMLHQLWRDRQHRFLHPDSLDAHSFQKKLNQRIQQVQSIYPWII